MKICIKCDGEILQETWICPSCGFTPVRKNGYFMFAKELSEQNEGFKPEYFEELAKLESENFWFCSRNRLILWALDKYFPKTKNFLEIGCGTGFVLSAIEKKYPKLDLYGSEIYSKGLEFAGSRISRAMLFQMDAKRIPFRNEFDVIGAFDVLEHISEDSEVLSMIYKAVKPNGGIILTVPQHKFLWSKYDEFSHHIRRYSRKELILKVKTAGFKIISVTSFVSLLLPLVIASRLKWRVSEKEYDSMSQYNLGAFMNNLLEQVLSFELMLIKIGIRFSFGSSLLLVAYKEK